MEKKVATNCWQYMNCQREPGGAKAAELGVCPAATESRCQGINHGDQAGRVCWLVAGTLCGQVAQGTFAQGMESCTLCKFYQLVHQEEGTDLQPDSVTLTNLGNPEQLVHAYEELRNTYRSLQEMNAHLIEARKLEAVGQLAAGVAHEINTPIQYIGDNLTFLKEAFGSLLHAVNRTGSTTPAPAPNDPAGEPPADPLAVDIEYLSRNIPQAIDQSLEGVRRVAEIVRAMRDFSHPGTGNKEAVDIHRSIQDAIIITRNEWKHVAQVTTEFGPEVPMVLCYAAEFNQVMLNLLVNAAHAIGEATHGGADGKGVIQISTRRAETTVEIRVRDTGTGIPVEIQSRIFEPFFTTKPIGVGTGQGLFMAYTAIVKKLKGTLRFETQFGEGTSFIIGLPLKADSPATSNEPA